MNGAAALIVALSGMFSALGAAVWQGIKFIRSQVRAELLQQQATETIEAKNQEIAELKAENSKLWKLLEGLTR